MKYLILLTIVVAVLFLAKLSRRADQARRQAESKTGDPVEKQALLACAQCGVHLPENETLLGRGGVFCGEAHRSAFERAHPL